MLGRATTGRRKTDVTGILFAQFDQIFDIFGRLGFVADQQIWRDTDQRDRHKVALDHIAKLGHQTGRQRVAVDVSHQQSVAIAGLLGNVVSRDHTSSTRFVVDDDGEVPHDRELLPHHARQCIGATTRREADHDTDRPVGQGLRLEHGCGDQSGTSDGATDKSSALHDLSPVGY